MKSLKDLTKITIMDKDGNKEEYNILAIFEKDSKTYIAYVDKEDNIQGARCNLTTTGIALEYDLSDAEYDLIDEYIQNN